MRWYGYPAVASMIACQFLMFKRVEPFYTGFTPIQWWNYIFLADAIVWGRQKKSLITDKPLEFIAILVLSNICWLVYEGYNLVLKNWYYTGLAPDEWQRLLGSFFAFATIFPGIFLSADLLESFGLFKDRDPLKPRSLPPVILQASFFGGIAAVIFPLVFPSRYVFGSVWLGYFFLLDPVNYWRGNPSIFGDIEKGKWQRFWALLFGGGICGLLWEFWNYWAKAKWIYTVPFTENTKYFEMPILGFIGFLPFALECFAMYHFTRSLLSRRAPG